MPFKTRLQDIQSFTISKSDIAAAQAKFALRRVVQILPSRNERKMADMAAALSIFSNNASSPTGLSGLSAFVGTLQHLMSPVRHQMEISSASVPRDPIFEIENCVLHVNYFAAVLRLAITVDAEAFEEANVTRSAGVKQTVSGKHAALMQRLLAAIQNCMTAVQGLPHEDQLKIASLREAVRNIGVFLQNNVVI